MADWTPERVDKYIDRASSNMGLCFGQEIDDEEAEDLLALLRIAQRGLSAEQDAAKARALERDAARWRGLMSCQRIRGLGMSGTLKGINHVGLELWITFDRSYVEDSNGRVWLTQLADNAFALCPEPKAEGETNGN